MPIRPFNRGQRGLFPDDIRLYLGANHLSIVVCELVEHFDTRAFYERVSDEGPPRYDPDMMLALLTYSYCERIYSSRDIAKRLKTDFALVYITGKQQPDFRTINRFRKDNIDLFAKFFKETVRYCGELGMATLEHIAIDGTKIQANASNAATYTDERTEKEIEEILKKASEIDDMEDEKYGEDNDGSGIPDDIQERLTKLDEIKHKLEKEQEAQGGGKKVKVNATDSDAKFMKMYGIGTHIGYNAQAAVDGYYQIIVAADVVNAQIDDKQLIPMVLGTAHNTGRFPERLTADGGYGTARNYSFLDFFKIDGYVKLKGYKKRKGKFHSYKFHYDDDRDVYICPADKELIYHREYEENGGLIKVYRCKDCLECEDFGKCTTNKKGRTIHIDEFRDYRIAMEEKLDTAEGKRFYKKRAPTVESVFGDIKWNGKFKRFSLRGLDNVKGEFDLLAAAHNIKKIQKYLV